MVLPKDDDIWLPIFSFILWVSIIALAISNYQSAGEYTNNVK